MSLLQGTRGPSCSCQHQEHRQPTVYAPACCHPGITIPLTPTRSIQSCIFRGPSCLWSPGSPGPYVSGLLQPAFPSPSPSAPRGIFPSSSPHLGSLPTPCSFSCVLGNCLLLLASTRHEVDQGWAVSVSLCTSAPDVWRHILAVPRPDHHSSEVEK